MPTIEFRTFNKESFEVFRPVAAKDLQPDWWKKQKIRVDQRGRTTQTIRSCPSMQDWLTMGYYIVATQYIPVRNGVTWYYPDGGEGVTTQNYSSTGTQIRIARAGYKGDLPYGATIAYIKDGEFIETGQTVASVTGTNNTYFTVNTQTQSPTYTINTGTTVIFNYNPYCLLYTSPSPRDVEESRMPSSA